MIYVSDTTRHKRAKKRFYKVSFGQFATDVEKAARCIRNMQFASDGIGNVNKLQQQTFGYQAVKILHKSDKGLYILANDGVYLLEKYNTTRLLSTQSNKACCCVYRDMLVVSVSSGTYALQQGVLGKVCDTQFDSMAVFGEKVWGAAGNTLYCSQIGDGANWQEECTISLPTACTKLVVASSKMYAFGETIYLITSNAKLPYTKVEKVSSSHKAFEESIVECNGKVYFACKEGYKKIRHKTVVDALPWYKSNKVTSVVSCSWNGYLYSALHFDDGKNACVVCFDVSNEKVISVYNYDCISVATDGQLAFICKGKVYLQSEVGDAGSVIVEKVDFGTAKTKYLRNVYVKCSGDVRIKLNTATTEVSMVVKASNSIQCVKLIMPFDELDVTVSVYGKCNVSYLGIDYVVY